MPHLKSWESGSKLKIRLVAGGLEKGRDLFAGNQHFPQHLATGQFPAGQQPPDGLGAHIEDLSGLVDVVQHGFHGGGFTGSVGRRFNVCVHIFGLFCGASLRHARLFSQNRAQKDARSNFGPCGGKLRGKLRNH